MRKGFFLSLTSCLSWHKRQRNSLASNFNLSCCSSTAHLFPRILGLLMPPNRDITKLSNPTRTCVGRTRGDSCIKEDCLRMLLLAVSVRLETKRGSAYFSTQGLTGDMKAFPEIYRANGE
ncbi:hypothetical protein K443DRAFT_130507 [Laccaria amethystina LaAM-08-1]|uniref:Uncharacterized protein n=1 Tax=Laccaria amethystina LaAM-08-1 TaxID=1095629 RepID=A0A0C9XU48_9AGAR|nr:hypothetical protein K443DRAFT_130507 [Laccaria amethystina LaAM-08-1]